MTALLLEFALRSVLIAAGTALVLWMLRIRAATLRHAAWTAVVVAMLVLPGWLAAGVRLSLPVWEPAPVTSNIGVTNPTETTSPVVPPTISKTPVVEFQPLPASSPDAPRWIPFDWQTAVLSIYVAGVLVLMLRLLVGTAQANRLRRSAAVQDGRLTSARCTTPITVGWFAPSLILPDGWQHWPATKLEAVLTHEREHGRRHDPLVQWFALLNRAIFWFHPLAWWLERRLSVLAEEACDAVVIAAGHSAQDYSEYLLEMARAVSRDGGRVHLGMAMPGTGLSRRLRLIFLGLPAARYSRTQIVLAIVFCAASSAVFASGALVEQTSVPIGRTFGQDITLAGNHTGSTPPLSSPVSTRQRVARPLAHEAVRSQQTQAQPPSSEPQLQIKFEAVSIRPCDTSAPTGGRGGGTSMRNAITPGYASWGCVTLSQLVDQAYGGGPFPRNSLLNTIRVPPGQRLDTPKRIRGGPSWVENEHYAIEIRLSGDTTNLTGSRHHNAVLTAMAPALRAMLEDRFQLKLRKATEDQPMYALSVITPRFNMTVSAPEKCWNPEDYPRPPGLGRTELPPPPPGWEGIPACGYQANGGRVRGNSSMEFTHIGFADFARWLSSEMDRYVLDRTGTPGRFSFKLEFAPDESTPGITESARMFARAGEQLLGRPAPEVPKPDGPTIFKALETLGLKLAPTRGPAEYLLIESAQRPRPNFAQASSGRPN